MTTSSDLEPDPARRRAPLRPHLPMTGRARAHNALTRLERLGPASMRLALGAVFALFGALKLVPGMSPAEEIAERTTAALSLGVIHGRPAVLLVAAMEIVIGLTFLTGRALHAGSGVFLLTLVGILAPVALFPGELFAGPHYAPTLLGQYVLKDLVLAAGGVSLTASVWRR